MYGPGGPYLQNSLPYTAQTFRQNLELEKRRISDQMQQLSHKRPGMWADENPSKKLRTWGDDELRQTPSAQLLSSLPAHTFPNELDYPTPLSNPAPLGQIVEVSTPEWLPPGYRAYGIKRTTGATVGRIDKYFLSPEGVRYRSEVELLNALKNTNYAVPLSRAPKKQAQYLQHSPRISTSRPKRESQLERTFKEEETFACDHWVGRRVETYWGVPAEKRGFYPGVIIGWKRVKNDIEYLVKYDGGEDTPVSEQEWESVDEGFRFDNIQYSDELKRALQLRKLRGASVKVEFEKPTNLGASEAKRTRIGPDFQANLAVIEIGGDYDDDVNVGRQVWAPPKDPTEVESFLNQYQNTSISYSEGVVFHEKHILTREEILYIHFRQKSTPIRPLADILRNYTWSPYKPHYRATWTEQEMDHLKIGMSTDYQNFNAIQLVKSLKDIIDFYFHWKHTRDFKSGKREHIWKNLGKRDVSRDQRAYQRSLAKGSRNPNPSQLHRAPQMLQFPTRQTPQLPRQPLRNNAPSVISLSDSEEEISLQPQPFTEEDSEDEVTPTSAPPVPLSSSSDSA